MSWEGKIYAESLLSTFSYKALYTLTINPFLKMDLPEMKLLAQLMASFRAFECTAFTKVLFQFTPAPSVV